MLRVELTIDEARAIRAALAIMSARGPAFENSWGAEAALHKIHEAIARERADEDIPF